MRTLNFEELNLHKSTLETLHNNNLKEATPLQQAILSNLTNSKDLIINPAEEADKHTAFAISAIQTLRQNEHEGSAVLFITDTPENISAIESRIQDLGLPNDENSIRLADDGDADQQAEAIREEPAIIIANPDRLQHLLQEHRFIFRHISLLVLDNVDLLISNEQADNLKRIKRRVLSDYTTIACASSIDAELKKVISNFAEDPAVMGFGDENSENPTTPPAISGNIKQGYINVPHRMKISTLMAHIGQSSDNRCVVFTASKRGTDRLYRVLKKDNLKATSLHGKLSDEKRAQRFSNFTNGDVQYLLVSDITAAELDVKGVDQVINYDVPNSSDEYRFRAALLGSGNSVQIVSLVSKQDRSDISELQNELGQTPDEIPLPDEVKKKLKERKQKKSSNGQKKSRGRGKQQKKSRSKKSNKESEMELPRPSYDKLSGGRSGNHDKKKTGIVKFFKKLFTS